MAISNENNPMIVVIPVGSLTTDATVIPAGYLPKKCKIVGAHVLNGADVAASDSNYCGLKVRKGTTDILTFDSRAANQGALTANTGKAMALVSGQETQDAGSSLNVIYNETGTMALTNAMIVLQFYPL